MDPLTEGFPVSSIVLSEVGDGDGVGDVVGVGECVDAADVVGPPVGLSVVPEPVLPVVLSVVPEPVLPVVPVPVLPVVPVPVVPLVVVPIVADVPPVAELGVPLTLPAGYKTWKGSLATALSKLLGGCAVTDGVGDVVGEGVVAGLAAWRPTATGTGGVGPPPRNRNATNSIAAKAATAAPVM